MDIDQKVTELLEESVSSGGKCITAKMKDMLMELEPACKDTAIYKGSGKSLEESPEFLRMYTAEDLFEHMCQKIGGAPTILHAAATPRLMIPLICERLRKEEKIRRKMAGFPYMKKGGGHDKQAGPKI